MKLQPFLLDQWPNRYHFAGSPVEFDLASSTGPSWTMHDLMEMSDANALEELFGTRLVYSHASGGEALRREIAGMQGVSPEHVQVVTGASEALLILFFLAAEPQANVVLPFPCFPTMQAIPESLGLETRFYRLRRENEYRIDPDEIKRLIDGRTKLVLINSPHNPTGATLSDDVMSALHDYLAERSVQLVVDEVYHPIYNGRPSESAARLERATVLGDFSKAFCLSGLRAGWIIERDPKRIEQYLDARSYFTISNSPVSEAMAVVAVQNREKIFGRARQIVSSNLALLDRFMSDHAGFFGWVRPVGGMTAFPWLVSDKDARGFCESLAEQGVLLAPGDCFQMPSHFRLGFGASGDRFPQALKRLDGFLRSQKPEFRSRNSEARSQNR
jgi:aspartate/methionine/tyrosine aminotransferase